MRYLKNIGRWTIAIAIARLCYSRGRATKVLPRRPYHLEFFSLFLPLAITASEGPDSYFSLAIMALGAFGFVVPKKTLYRLGKMELRSLGSLIYPDLLSLFSFGKRARKTAQKKQGFFLASEPLKIPGKEGKKRAKEQGTPCQRKPKRKPKRQGKEDEGKEATVFKELRGHDGLLRNPHATPVVPVREYSGWGQGHLVHCSCSRCCCRCHRSQILSVRI